MTSVLFSVSPAGAATQPDDRQQLADVDHRVGGGAIRRRGARSAGHALVCARAQERRSGRRRGDRQLPVRRRYATTPSGEWRTEY